MGSHLLMRFIAWGSVAVVLLLCGWPAPVLAHDDDGHGCHSRFHRALQLRYDAAGAQDVQFNLGAQDFDNGYQDVMNHGHLHWWSNTSHWRIKLQRTAWTQTQGEGFPDADGAQDIHLRIKTDDAPVNTWFTVPTTSTTWLSSCHTGTGTIDGVDWEIDRLHDDAPYGMLPPGTYSCTVTFTIEHST
jgi:hypothetical protein